jgi:hypothetical protein
MQKIIRLAEGMAQLSLWHRLNLTSAHKRPDLEIRSRRRAESISFKNSHRTHEKI